MQQYRKFFITYHWTCCTWVPLLEPEIKRCLYHRADQVLYKKLGSVPGSVYVVVGPAFVQPVSLMYIFEQRWTIQVGTTGFGECFSEPGVGRFFYSLYFSFLLQCSGAFFLLLIGCPMANFGPFTKGQPHSPDVNHCVLHF